MLSRCSKTWDAAVTEGRIKTTSVIRGAVEGKGTLRHHKGQHSVFIALQVRVHFILWFLQFSHSLSAGIFYFIFCRFTPDLVHLFLSQYCTVALGNARAWQLTWGGTWSVGFPAAQPVRRDIPGTRGSLYPPPSASAHVMFSFMSCLPLMHQEEETSFHLRAWRHLPTPPPPYHFPLIFFFQIMFERTSSVTLQPLSSNHVHPDRVSSLFGQLTARHGRAFRVPYQTEVLSYAWCAPDLATVRVHKRSVF